MRHHQHQRDESDRTLAGEGLREGVVGAAVHVEQRRGAARVERAAGAEVLLLVAHRERLAGTAQDRQERSEPQARGHVRLPIGHLRDRPGPRGETVHRVRTAGDPNHDEAGADCEDHGRGSDRDEAAQRRRPRTGGRQPDDGGDDAGGDDRPRDPAAALVAEDDGDERDGQESDSRGKPDETASAWLATDRAGRAGLGFDATRQEPQRQDRRRREAQVLGEPAGVAERRLQSIGATEVGERIGGAQHPQIEVAQAIEGGGGDGEDESREDAAGHEQRRVRVAGGRRALRLGADRDRHRQRGHGGVQREHDGQDRIDDGGDIGGGERAGEQPQRFTERGGIDDVGGRVERQAAQAEHRRADIARQRQTGRRPQHVQRRGAITCPQPRQPARDRARGQDDEGDERPGRRTVPADGRHGQQDGDSEHRPQAGERGQRQAGDQGEDRPAPRVDEQRDRPGRRSQAERDRQRRARRAQHPRGTRAGGSRHGWDGPGIRTTTARRRRPAIQSSTSD